MRDAAAETVRFGMKQLPKQFPERPIRKLRKYGTLLRDAVFILPALVIARFARTTRARDRNVVVFASLWPTAREAKLAKGLRALGWKVVLLYSIRPNYSVGDSFSESHRIAGPWEALYRAGRMRPFVHHVFAGNADRLSQLFVSMKPGLVVYDAVDIVAGLIEVERGRGKNERLRRLIDRWQSYCLAQADGLCCKDVQAKAYARKTGKKIARRNVWLPDLCTHRPRPRGTEDDELHVVSAGTLPDESSPQEGAYPLIEALTRHDIHVHLYPSFAYWQSLSGGRCTKNTSDFSS